MVEKGPLVIYHTLYLCINYALGTKLLSEPVLIIEFRYMSELETKIVTKSNILISRQYDLTFISNTSGTIKKSYITVDTEVSYTTTQELCAQICYVFVRLSTSELYPYISFRVT